MGLREKNQLKVLETKKLLSEIISKPIDYKENEVLKLALKSQSSLAKFSDESQGILSCSLNTLKSASDLLLDRGFDELDQLRINARNAIEAASDRKKEGTLRRSGLIEKVRELEWQLNDMKRCNFQLTVIISELRSELKHLAYTEYESIEQKKSKYVELNKIVEKKLNFTLYGQI